MSTSPVLGIGSILGLAAESTYGTSVTPSTRWLPVTKATLSLMPTRDPIPHLFSAAATPTNGIQRDWAETGVDAGGSIEWVPAYDHKATALMFAYAFNAAFTTTGSGPYTHVLDLALPASSLKALTVQQVVGTHASITELARVADGVVINSFELTLKARSLVTCKVDVIARTIADPAAVSGTPAYLPSEEILSSHAAVAIAWNSRTDLAVTDATVKVNNNLVRVPFVGSLYTGRPAPNGFQTVTVSAKVYASETDLLATFQAGTAADLTITLTGSGNNSLAIVLHNAPMTKCELVVDGAGLRVYDVEWRAHNSAAEAGCKLTLINDNSSAV